MLKRIAVLAALAALAGAGSGLPAAESAVTTASYAWLAGSWQGKVSGLPNATADVTFQPPKAGVILGVMRLLDNGKITLVELISLVDTPGGLEMRFRHFSPSLDAFEPQFKQAMQLSRHETCADTFTNTVDYQKDLASTQPRVTKWIHISDDEFVGYTDYIDDGGKPAVLEARYTRVR